MPRLTALLVAAALAAPACAMAEPARKPAATKKAKAMKPGFETALSAFREYALKKLNITADNLDLGYPSEETASTHELAVGKAWVFFARRKDKPAVNVGCWVTADGTVITPEQNLGILFAEAGVWTEHPKLDAKTLAERIIWAWGTEFRLLEHEWDSAPPELHLEPDGHGTLRFSVGYTPSPHGYGPPLTWVYDCTVTLTPDHKAVLTPSKNRNGDPDRLPPAWTTPPAANK